MSLDTTFNVLSLREQKTIASILASMVTKLEGHADADVFERFARAVDDQYHINKESIRR